MDHKHTNAVLSQVFPASRITGTGEMADLVRAFDWVRSPLGAIERWSDTLVITVNVLLESRHPMFLWWGPELIQFYNDGYRSSLGEDKHPFALGQRGVDCWPEIWSIIGPQIAPVLERGNSSWNKNQLVPINRNGRIEEVFWTYGYSPVRDKAGTICGVLVVCSETTEQVVSERRLRALMTIMAGSPAKEESSESKPLLLIARNILRRLDTDVADLPFAALYLSNQGEIFAAGRTTSAHAISDPKHWPLEEVLNSQTPQHLEDLQQRFGDLFLPPWPEPVRRAYVLPLRMDGSQVQAILVLGISPRLPFDESYQTFFRLLGTRIAELLLTEIHKLEISEAAEKFSALVKANPFGTIIGDLRGGLSYVNPAFLKTIGYSEADVSAGQVRWDNLTPPEFVHEDAKAMEQLRTTGRCEVYEKAFIAKDGRRIPILIGATAIDSPQGEPEIAAFVTDLTPLKAAQEALRTANEELEKKVAERTAAMEVEIAERKRAENSLRQLTGRLLRTQDEERRHMARELHDHAGQTLVALGMNFSALLDVAKGQDPRILSLLAESQELSTILSKELRTLSYLLHPPLLDEVGLGSALKWFVEGFSQRSGIAVDLQLPENSARLPKEVELVLFRVIQESLTNIHRHSGSSSASICLTHIADSVEVEISDKGKGISPERRRQMKNAQVGVGLRGMEERVRQFGGTLQITSGDAGTQVVVAVPLTVD